jgi:two-component system, NarL family, nitrate/nitrite response regulator NarL
MTPLPRLVLADDHRLLLDAFAHLLADVATLVGTATDGDELLDVVARTSPDLVIADVAMPKRSGIDAARVIAGQSPAPRIIMLTLHADPLLAASAFRAGAMGFVLKTADAAELRHAIGAVMEGHRYVSPGLLAEVPEVPLVTRSGGLTSREHEVLTHVARGLTARSISQQLGITERTVNFHKQNLKVRLGVSTTAQALGWLYQHGTAVDTAPVVSGPPESDAQAGDLPPSTR